MPPEFLRRASPGVRSPAEIGVDTPFVAEFPVGAVLHWDPPNVWGVEIARHASPMAGGSWSDDPPLKTEADFDRLVATVPLRRSPRLAEFGRTVRYLVETPSITGQMIALDGGQHIAWETPDVVGIPE